MYTIRFHLGRGPHFMHWQIKSPAGIYYVDPAKVSLLLTGCKLRNRRKTAEQITAGAQKTVCAWVAAEGVVETLPVTDTSGSRLSYNPRRVPYWCDEAGANVDNSTHGYLVTSGSSIFIPAKCPPQYAGATEPGTTKSCGSLTILDRPA